MYAIIKTGGKQYRVKKGDKIDVELLEGEQGSTVDFAPIFVQDGSKAHVGAPNVAGFVVTAKIVGESKGEKITSVKYIPGNHYKKFGHRQKYTRVEISDIAHKR
jgi:large subunit ribosomal protein L21